ncbi:MAG: VWA domain-containing protein [Thermoanaerobaculia bacterium]
MTISHRLELRSAPFLPSLALPAAVVALLGLLAVPLPAPLAAQDEPTFGEAIEVRRVNVDVVVTNANDVPVTGLTADDFALFEDGKKVEILNFAAYDEATPAASAAPAVPGEGAAGEVASLATPVSWVVYVDSAKLGPGLRNAATKNVQEFLAGKSQPADRLLVAGFDGTALRLYSPLTRDRLAFSQSLEALVHTGGEAVARRSRGEMLIQQLQSVLLNLNANSTATGEVESLKTGRAPTDPTVEPDTFWIELTSYVNDEAQRETNSLRALDQLLGMVSGIDGRVALVLVGAPIEVKPGDPIVRRAESRLGSSPDAARRMRDIELHQVDLTPQLTAVLQRANASRVTIFTIDASDNRELGMNQAEEKGLPGLAEASRFGNGSASASFALSALAEATGGRAYTASTTLTTKLGRAAGDLRTYYSLGYEPTRAEAGGFHKLEVRMRPAGLQARYRQGVRERDPNEVSSDAAVAALLGSPPENAFGLRVKIGTPDKNAPRARRKLTPVSIELPLASVLLMPDSALHRGQIDFYFALVDSHQILQRTESKRLDFSIPNDQLAQSLANYVTYQVELPVAKGSYQLSVVAVDRIGGESSTLVTPFTVAAN